MIFFLTKLHYYILGNLVDLALHLFARSMGLSEHGWIQYVSLQTSPYLPTLCCIWFWYLILGRLEGRPWFDTSYSAISHFLTSCSPCSIPVFIVSLEAVLLASCQLIPKFSLQVQGSPSVFGVWHQHALMCFKGHRNVERGHSSHSFLLTFLITISSTGSLLLFL